MPRAFSYDGDGNMQSDGHNWFTWDAENRLVSVQNSAFGLVEFAYDAFGRRAYLTEKPDGLHETRVANLLWEGLTIVGQVEIPPTGILANPARLYFGNGERRLMAAGAGPNVNLLYTRDHLGSIRELVDASDGVVRAAYDYTPYGIRTKLPSIGGDLDSDFGFTGHYTNERTGLVLAPYRAYSPELGRWISRDPIEEDGGINLYGYVGNGPLGWIDPDGLAPRPTFLEPGPYVGQATSAQEERLWKAITDLAARKTSGGQQCYRVDVSTKPASGDEVRKALMESQVIFSGHGNKHPSDSNDRVLTVSDGKIGYKEMVDLAKRSKQSDPLINGCYVYPNWNTTTAQSGMMENLINQINGLPSVPSGPLPKPVSIISGPR